MLCFLNFIIFLTCMILISTLYSILKSVAIVQKEQTSPKILSLPVNDGENKAQKQQQEHGFEVGPEDLPRSLLLGILPLNSPKRDALFGKKCEDVDEDDPPGGGSGSGQEDKRGRKKKKRARKKRSGGPNEEGVKEKEELVCLYPFTKCSSATQRKIKQQYDQLVKSHGSSNGMTLEQVGTFINYLVEAKNELQNKSEVIKRRFTITKALLFKADRSSFDRLCQQIYKLELEQKRIEEDAFVYNWLHEQLKVSPGYKKLLEIGACLKKQKETSIDRVESTDADFSDISFEELLAQEKKDSFWQKNGKLKSCSAR